MAATIPRGGVGRARDDLVDVEGRDDAVAGGADELT